MLFSCYKRRIKYYFKKLKSTRRFVTDAENAFSLRAIFRISDSAASCERIETRDIFPG